MQKIELDCFKDSQKCVFLSERERFSIKAPNEEYQLTLNNFSEEDCEISLSLISNENFTEDLKLQVFSEKELFFNENLSKTAKKTINLGGIHKKSLKNYDFYFIFDQNQEISFNFDLILNFSCQKQLEKEVFIPKTATSSTKTKEKTTGQVLGQSHSLQATKTPEEKPLRNSKLKFSLYLILLVVLIFVIMTVVNGKKQKKNLQKKEKKF